MKWRRISEIEKAVARHGPRRPRFDPRTGGRHAGLPDGSPAAATGHSRLLDRILCRRQPRLSRRPGQHLGKRQPVRLGRAGCRRHQQPDRDVAHPPRRRCRRPDRLQLAGQNVVFGWEGDGQWLAGSSTVRQRRFPVRRHRRLHAELLHRARDGDDPRATRLGLRHPHGLRHRRRAPWGGSRISIRSPLRRDGTRVAGEHDGAAGMDRRRRHRVEIPARMVGQGRVSLLPHGELQHDDSRLSVLPEQRHRRPPQLHRQFRPRRSQLAPPPW